MPSLAKIHSFDEVFDSQRLFRQILTVMANPVRAVSIREFSDKLYGENPEILVLAMTLLDNEVSFCAPENERLAEEINFLTFSAKQDTEKADYIFITEESALENAIKSAKCGTLRDPHKSATVIVKIKENKTRNMCFYGPRIKDTVSLSVPETVFEALELRKAQNYEYPQGVDFIFINKNGEIFSIPRLVTAEEL